MTQTLTSTYLVDDVCYEADDAGFQDALVEVHALRLRPLCMCREDGLPMYVARSNGRFLLKRMPLSGRAHSPDCSSYEPPDEVGGLGQLRGTAIQESAEEEGVTLLNLGYPFTKGATRKPPAPSETPADTVKVEKSRLSLLSTLHYLWREAELTRWAPGMSGKRSWGLVRRELLTAAEGARAKGQPLAERLYIPEPFVVDHKAEISARRTGALAKLMTSGPARQRPLMLLIGEVKGVESARYDKRVVIKHCPDFSFFLTDDAHKKLAGRFEREIATWNGLPDGHLMMVALFSVPPSGFAQIEEASLMLTDEHWLPVDGGLDLALTSELVRERRVFERSLRFNMPAAKPAAIAVLQDTAPKPTALFIRPAGASETYLEALNAITQSQAGAIDTWTWAADEGAIPALPARSPSVARAAALPIYLLLCEQDSEPARLVTLNSPRRMEVAGEAARLVAQVREELEVLEHLAPERTRAVGRPVHVRPERPGCLYRRVSPGELAELRNENRAAKDRALRIERALEAI